MLRRPNSPEQLAARLQQRDAILEKADSRYRETKSIAKSKPYSPIDLGMFAVDLVRDEWARRRAESAKADAQLYAEHNRDELAAAAPRDEAARFLLQLVQPEPGEQPPNPSDPEGAA